MKKIYIFVSIAILISMAGCGAPTPMEQIRLPVGFIPNVQFAPLYVAIDQGYFRDQGLDVSLDYSMEADNVALVGANKLPFAIVSGEQVLLGRAQGLPIVYVAAWYQQYPVAVASLKTAGITTAADLKGKRIGTPILSGASYIGLEAILRAAKLSDKDIQLDTIGFTQVESLIAGLDDAVVVYTSNEPVQLEQRGYPVNLIKVSDSLQLVGNGLLTNENTIKQNPALVRKMTAAILKGIQYTIDNPNLAYQICLKYVENLKADDPIQKQILLASIELWKTSRLGYSDPTAWANMETILKDMGLVKQPLDVTQAYSNDFLP